MAPNAITCNGCNGVTVFVTFLVLFGVFDYSFRRGFVTGIKYKFSKIFHYLLRYFFEYSIFAKICEFKLDLCKTCMSSRQN